MPAAVVDELISMIPGLDFDHISWSEIVEVNAAFDLRLNDLPVDLVAKVAMRHFKSCRGESPLFARH